METVIFNLFGSSTFKSIITLISLFLGYKITMYFKKLEIENARRQTEKNKIDDQAGIDIPNSNLQSDYEDSQKKLRDMFRGN